MSVAMKLPAALVVRPSARRDLLLSQTALLSDSCNHPAGYNASRAASRVVAGAEVTVGATPSVSTAPTAPTISAKTL